MGVIEDLEKIKQLKDAGAITETEFEIEKQKILKNNVSNETATDKKATKAMVGFILGLVGIIAWFLPIIGVPEELKKYFWDTKFEKLDIRKNKRYIISRLYCYGDLKAIKWIKETYSKEDIKKLQ